jgi:hypothetical protein
MKNNILVFFYFFLVDNLERQGSPELEIFTVEDTAVSTNSKLKMQSLSTLVKDFLSQSIVIFMPQQQYVRGQTNLPLSIRTYKILWYTAVRLSLRSHVV